MAKRCRTTPKISSKTKKKCEHQTKFSNQCLITSLTCHQFKTNTNNFLTSLVISLELPEYSFFEIFNNLLLELVQIILSELGFSK